MTKEYICRLERKREKSEWVRFRLDRAQKTGGSCSCYTGMRVLMRLGQAIVLAETEITLVFRACQVTAREWPCNNLIKDKAIQFQNLN